MKDCKKIHLLLPLYRENQLSASEKAAVEKHVGECPAAREELKQWERLGKALKNMPEPKMPRGLHEKIMARLHGKPVPLSNRFWPRASWGLAAAASLGLIFLVQNFNWMGQNNSEIVLKPTSPASVNGVCAKVSSSAGMVLKPQPHRSVNQPAVFIAPKQEMTESDIKVQANAVTSAQMQIASATPPMVLALGPTERSKKKAFTENERAFTSDASANVAAAPQAAFAPEANNNGQAEGKLKYQEGHLFNAMSDVKQTPQFMRFNIIGVKPGQYQVTWATNLVSQGQLFILDSTGNTLQAAAETTPPAYDHQMVIDASTINTDFFIKILATYLNGNQGVTVSNVLKPQ